MNLKPALWMLSLLLFWMAWPADAPSALANDPAHRTSGRVDDTWTATNTVGGGRHLDGHQYGSDPPPSPRSFHTAVWTGTAMVVWGGYDGRTYFNTGGRYDPATDTWAAISLDGAPTGRFAHTAVWTGSEMIVWGGASSLDQFNTGGRYFANSRSVSPPPSE